MDDVEFLKKCVDEIHRVAKEYFGEVEFIEPIGIRKTVCKVVANGVAMKAKVWSSSEHDNLDIHHILASGGVRVPKPIAEVPMAKDFGLTKTIRFMEWIEGTTYNYALEGKRHLASFPKDFFYQVGEVLGEISNFKIRGLYIAMGDIIWPQFVTTKEGKLYLVDITKLFLSEDPEKWFFHNIIYYPHITDTKKMDFIEGYLDRTKPRAISSGLKMARVFINRIYEKLERGKSI